MPHINSNLVDARKRFDQLEDDNFGVDEGFYLILVKIKDGNTAGASDQFEVMGRKFGKKTRTKKGTKHHDAYRINGKAFSADPVQINYADEGEWHLVTA